jgi:hypothetical protein
VPGVSRWAGPRATSAWLQAPRRKHPLSQGTAPDRHTLNCRSAAQVTMTSWQQCRMSTGWCGSGGQKSCIVKCGTTQRECILRFRGQGAGVRVRPRLGLIRALSCFLINPMSVATTPGPDMGVLGCACRYQQQWKRSSNATARPVGRRSLCVHAHFLADVRVDKILYLRPPI